MLLGVLALGGTGCGASGTPHRQGATGPGPTVADTRADKVALHAYDFPPGWHEVTDVSGVAGESDSVSEAVRCLGLSDPTAQGATVSLRRAFELNTSTVAASSVATLPSDAAGSAVARAWASDSFRTCFHDAVQSSVQRSLGTDTTLVDVTIASRKVKAPSSVSAVGYDLLAHSTITGVGPSTAYLSYDFLARGSTLTVLGYFSTTVFPQTTSDALAAAVAGRMAE